MNNQSRLPFFDSVRLPTSVIQPLASSDEGGTASGEVVTTFVRLFFCSKFVSVVTDLTSSDRGSILSTGFCSSRRVDHRGARPVAGGRRNSSHAPEEGGAWPRVRSTRRACTSRARPTGKKIRRQVKGSIRESKGPDLVKGPLPRVKGVIRGFSDYKKGHTAHLEGSGAGKGAKELIWRVHWGPEGFRDPF